MNPQTMLNVLIVDDDIFIADILKRLAQKIGCAVNSIHDGTEVRGALLKYDPDVIFLDLVLPGLDGVEVIRGLADCACKAKIVLMSGLDKRTLSSVSEVARKYHLDILDAITKPFAPGQVEKLLSQLIETKADTRKAQVPVKNDARFGPQLLYEPEIRLSESKSNGISWMRVRPAWKLDDNHLADLTNILIESAKPTLSKGIFELIARGLLDDNILLHRSEVGIKLPLFDDLLADSSTPNYLEQIVKRARVESRAIMFEVNESAIMNPSTEAVDIFSRLKIKGFNLAVCVRDRSDEVLSVLKRLPIDEIVLSMRDNRFRDSKINDSETEFQVGSLVSYASAADLTTSVSDVSSQSQITFAKHCGFSKASGSFIEKASDIGEALKKLGSSPQSQTE